MNYIDDWIYYLGENRFGLEKTLKLSEGTIRHASSRGSRSSRSLAWASALAAYLGLPLTGVLLTAHPTAAPTAIREAALHYCAERRLRQLNRAA